MNQTILIFLTILAVSNAIQIPDFFNLLINHGNSVCLAEATDLIRKLKETTTQHETDFGNMDVLYNRELMTSLTAKFKTISCETQGSNCSTTNFIRYFLNGAVFIGAQIYGEAFVCLSEEDLEPKFTECANGMVPKGVDVLEYLKPVSFCVSRKTECSGEDQKALVEAIHAGVDLYEVFKNAREVLEEMEKNQLKLEFKPEKYDHLMS